MFLIAAENYQIKKTKHKGRGVFVKKEIAPGTVIGDYLGQVLSDAAAEKFEKKTKLFYAMDYADGDLAILPEDYKKAGVHLINHSCTPNCDTFYYFGHTLFFSLRRILPGEEITIDYNFDSAESSPDDACFCHSYFCRGTMAVSDKKLINNRKLYQEQSRGQKFKIAKKGTVLQPLLNYPRVIKDSLLYDLYANFTVPPVVYSDRFLPTIREIRRRIRTTGRALKFKNLKLTILGINDGKLLASK
ncbi:MAG: SET domain-containing protein [Patescibacteria group bacterium]|jgi:hypothetical protein